MCVFCYTMNEVVFKQIMDLMENHQRDTNSTGIGGAERSRLLAVQIATAQTLSQKLWSGSALLIVALGNIWSHFHGVDDKKNCYHVSWMWHSGHGLEVNMVVVPGWWLDLVILEVFPNPNHCTILGLGKCKQALWKIMCFSEVKRLLEVLISQLWNGHFPFHKVELLYS